MGNLICCCREASFAKCGDRCFYYRTQNPTYCIPVPQWPRGAMMQSGAIEAALKYAQSLKWEDPEDKE